MALQVVPPEVSVLGLFEHALLQWLRLGIIVSVALLVGSLAQTFLYTVVVGSMAVLASQLVWIAQDTLANPEAVLSTVMRGALWLTTRIFPNLQGYNIGETLVLGQSTVLPGTVSSLSLSAAVYLVVILFLACTAFRRREI